MSTICIWAGILLSVVFSVCFTVCYCIHQITDVKRQIVYLLYDIKEEILKIMRKKYDN